MKPIQTISTRAVLLSLLMALALLGAATISSAQDPSATPTPTATGTPTRTVTSTLPPATRTPGGATTTDIEPLTQSDLTVLTGNVQRPNGIFALGDKLYTSCSGDWTVYEIEADTGRTITYSSGIRNAHTLYAEREGDRTIIFAPDFQLNQLVRADRGAAQPVATGLNGPWGIAYLDDDEFFITNLLGNTAVVVNREGELRTVLEGLASPAGVVITDERIFIGNNGSTRRAIEWYPRDVIGLRTPSPETEPSPVVNGIQNVTGLALADDGYLYFAYALGTRGVVGRVDPEVCIAAGGCGNDQVQAVLYTELSAPLAGLTITPDMRLYVHTMFAPDIYWVQLPE